MNDCTRIAPLLEVYADDEASAETNALVQDHLHRCDRCARSLRGLLTMRAGLREALGDGPAPAALRDRIHGAIDANSTLTQPHRWLPAALRTWLAPASAAAIVLAIWFARERPVEAGVDTAVAEHVACALEGRGAQMAPAEAAARGLVVAMPWIHDATGRIRMVEAHACGGPQPFSHLVLEVEGTTVSILIADRVGRGQVSTIDIPIALGAFDVSVLTTAKHVVYVIADRRARERMRALRAPTLQRVERFLQQMEGRS